MIFVLSRVVIETMTSDFGAPTSQGGHLGAPRRAGSVVVGHRAGGQTWRWLGCLEVGWEWREMRVRTEEWH